jgi:phage shock protein C
MRRFGYRNGKGLYRSRQGVILGVCRGLADYFDFSVFWFRFVMVLLLILTGLWPMLGIYLIASLIMKPEPVRPIETEDEAEFYDSYVRSRSHAVNRIRRRFGNLDRRLQRMEDKVTDKGYQWDRRFRAS